MGATPDSAYLPGTILLDAFFDDNDESPQSFYSDLTFTGWKSLNSQRLNKEFCDVIVKCGTDEFHAHKCVLASLSQYFKALFLSEIYLGQAKEGILTTTLHNFSEPCVRFLLDLLYGDRPAHAEDIDLVEFLKLVDYVQMDLVIEALVLKIRKSIDIDNCLQWYSTAHVCNIKKLEELVVMFIGANIHKIGWSRVVIELPMEYLQLLFSCENVKMTPFVKKNLRYIIISPQS